MQLSKWGFQADFVVYPLLILTVTLKGLWHTATPGAEHWLAAAFAGVLGWTLVEYAMHRWVLHRLQPFKRLHAMHHARPTALIGTPTWLSATLFAALWAVLGREVSVPTAAGLVAGLMTGYLAYVSLHFALHHRRTSPGSWLRRTKLRHARHHRPGSATDYGVSTGFWDRLFGTAPPSGR